MLARKQNQIGHDPQQVLKETDSMKSLSYRFSDESSPPVFHLLKATGTKRQETSHSATATSCPATNVLLPRNLCMSEKTLDSCSGQCLRPFGNAGDLLFANTAPFHPNCTGRASRSPQWHYFLLPQLLWCCWSHVLHLQSPVLLSWQVHPTSTSLCMQIHFNVLCYTAVRLPKQSMKSLRTCRHFNEDDFVSIQFIPFALPPPKKTSTPHHHFQTIICCWVPLYPLLSS